jgi:hypothetical protein
LMRTFTPTPTDPHAQLENRICYRFAAARSFVPERTKGPDTQAIRDQLAPSVVTSTKTNITTSVPNDRPGVENSTAQAQPRLVEHRNDRNKKVAPCG